MNKEDFSAWRSHPITREIFRYLEDDSTEIALDLATKDYGDQPSDIVARRQAEACGKLSVYRDIMRSDFCDYITSFNKIDGEEDEKVQ